MFCVECGARLHLVYERRPSWLLPTGIVLGIVLIAVVAVLLALDEVTDDAEVASTRLAPAPPQSSARPAPQGSDDASPAPREPPATPAPGQAPPASARGIDPASIEVSVLSGVGVPGIAARTGRRVRAKNFKLGVVANAADPLPSSTVLYARGKRREARAVARALGISRLEPLGAPNRSIARDADVVVVVGGDRRGSGE
jgi:hypothetical protein